jgi:hypothetical protein
MFWWPVAHGELGCYHQPKCSAHLFVVCPGNPVYLWGIDDPSGCSRMLDLSHRCWVRHGEPPSITVEKGMCPDGAGSISTHRRGDPARYHGFLYRGVLSDNLIGAACNPADRAKQQPCEIPDRSHLTVPQLVPCLESLIGERLVKLFTAATRVGSELDEDFVQLESEGPLRLALRALDTARSAGDAAEDVSAWFFAENPLLDGSSPSNFVAYRYGARDTAQRILDTARFFVDQASPEAFDRFLAANP